MFDFSWNQSIDAVLTAPFDSLLVVQDAGSLLHCRASSGWRDMLCVCFGGIFYS